MAKKNGGGGWGWLWLVGGAAALILVKTALDEEKTGAPIPADPGGRIDLIVTKLNEQFGEQWVTFGLNALKSYLQKLLPPEVVAMTNVVYQVEQSSPGVPGAIKRQVALGRLARW